MSNTGISSSSLTGQLEYINRQYHDVCELYEDLSKVRSHKYPEIITTFDTSLNTANFLHCIF